jgi:hypothetical protein
VFFFFFFFFTNHPVPHFLVALLASPPPESCFLRVGPPQTTRLEFWSDQTRRGSSKYPIFLYADEVPSKCRSAPERCIYSRISQLCSLPGNALIWSSESTKAHSFPVLLRASECPCLPFACIGQDILRDSTVRTVSCLFLVMHILFGCDYWLLGDPTELTEVGGRNKPWGASGLPSTSFTLLTREIKFRSAGQPILPNGKNQARDEFVHWTEMDSCTWPAILCRFLPHHARGVHLSAFESSRMVLFGDEELYTGACITQDWNVSTNNILVFKAANLMALYQLHSLCTDE